MDTRTINENYAKIGDELIHQEKCLEHILNSQASIIYLSSEQAKTDKGTKTLAQCERVPEKYKWGIPCDFTITVFEPNIVGMTDEQIRILLLHELLHIGITENDDGDETYSVIPHDLEDFKLIIDRYGTDWAKVDEDGTQFASSTEFEV